MEAPRSLAERLFSQALLKARLPKPEVRRNENGVLTYKWSAPCPDIEALYVSVQPRVITLSCKVSHIHFARDNYLRSKPTNAQFKRRMVQDAIREIQAFVGDRIAVTIAYDEDGKTHSSGWCKKEQLAESLGQLKNTFGAGMTQRAWLWSGAA